ncbi:MAG TPA: NAD(P)H-dependent glycerol-3-phosphate dehydrogenase [Verrucomicrobiae bacterium]|jgi:glycerol-3-phosphate dehydrogenase (NAD(P)+)|nr:NAD(P)H-dependent glycerol-3-phosphate dehydrogenase [Verrucomicrobiae bacterium]
MKVTVIGAGAWGTALASLLRKNGHDVILWGHNAAQLEQIAATGRNELYLPGIAMAPGIRCEADLSEAVAQADCVVIAVPSKFFRDVTSRIGSFKGLAVSVTKGIEYESGLTMSGILETTMPRALAAVLSGPSLALEVARDIPAAIVAAHSDAEAAREAQVLFHRPAFRVYTSQDVLGVELGGAVKNVVAIAAGIGDGLGYGDNTKAGLITRGVAEMRRLGIARGALPETFSGLSGLGDLVVTCYSRLSRNRGFGERVGRGERVEAILASTRSVAEGHPTAKAAWQLARKLGIETPIIDEVYDMLYQGKEVRKAVHDLMGRDMKPED